MENVHYCKIQWKETKLTLLNYFRISSDQSAANWPITFFACFLDRDRVQVHKHDPKKKKKKKKKPISSHLDRANLVNK